MESTKTAKLIADDVYNVMMEYQNWFKLNHTPTTAECGTWRLLKKYRNFEKACPITSEIGKKVVSLLH